MSTTGAMGKAGLVDEVPGRGATMHGTSRPRDSDLYRRWTSRYKYSWLSSILAEQIACPRLRTERGFLGDKDAPCVAT